MDRWRKGLVPGDTARPVSKIVFIVALTSAVTLTTASAQSADRIRLGDRAYASLDAHGALAHFEKAIAASPGSYEAHWKASRSAVDVGSRETDALTQAMLFGRGEEYARRAVSLEPADAEGHFSLARALGKTALRQSPRGRIRYATEIRTHTLECLKLNPAHAGCMHVMGMWNAEVMRLNSLTRLVAKKVLGGGIFGTASWNDAVRYMEAAVAAEPERIVHHADLAGIYRDRGQTAKAKAEFETVVRLAETDFNDVVYKSEARAALAR